MALQWPPTAVFRMGSDTADHRIPSSYSLVGLRVTQSLFSRDSIIPLSSRRASAGRSCLCRDIAVVLDATAGFDPNDATGSPWAHPGPTRRS